MKKGLLAFIIIVISIFIPKVYADQFEVLFKMDHELKDDTFTIQLGLREASTMAVMSNVVYNKDKLEFVSIDANEYFTVTKSNDMDDGVFKSFKVLADSDYGFQKVYYANVTFRIRDGLKKGERTDIYFNNNQVATADEIIKTSPSMVYTLYYNKDGTVDYVVSERNFMTTLNVYITNNWKLVLIILFVLVGLFIFIRYWLIVKDVKLFRKKHEHNHVVEKMKFAKVPKNLQTVIDDDKPEKIRIAKLGKWGKKKVKEEPVKQEEQVNDNLAKLMTDESEIEEEKINTPERGVFIGNQDTGNDNELPDDFSSFGESSSNYAYDDDTTTEEFDDSEGANLDDLSNISLSDEKKDNGSKIGLFLGLLLITGLFNIKPVNALSDTEMDSLRNMILGNVTWSAEYDINNDNTIDMLDIIATKDINNITIIQDSVSVEDSKPSNNFVLKSTSKYVRTTKPGQTKMKTTADGKWKNNNNNSNNNNNDGDVIEPGNNDVPDMPDVPDPIVVQPESIDKSNGGSDTRNIHINYQNGTGKYDNIKVEYNGSVTFEVYAPNEAYQKLNVSSTNGVTSSSGSYPTYYVSISNVTDNAEVTINFDKSPTINAVIVTGTNQYNFKNQYVDTVITQQLQFDQHYDLVGIECYGGIRNYTLSGNMFKGKISDKSGYCTARLSPRFYENVVKFQGRKMTDIKGKYNNIVQNLLIFNTDIKSDKYNLYCGNTRFSPKKVEWATETLGDNKYEGYRYIFDVKVTGEDCELR